MADPILVGRQGSAECVLLPAMANRHGLVTGATGTGKTVTLQLLAEQLSAQGVAVFAADVKGDLSGLVKPATPGEKVNMCVGAETPCAPSKVTSNTARWRASVETWRWPKL